MYDVIPDEVWIWQKLEGITKKLLNSYGYQEIRFPVLEKTELFHSSIGEVTDVVEKEMFSFPSRKGESISMRPEGTASTVRMALQHGLIYNDAQKFWYNCSMFRYEKPQKGRNRQFSQVGVEVFGHQGPDVDAEILLMTKRLWDLLGLENMRLEINTLGTSECRENYRKVLIGYFEQHLDVLDNDAKNRLYTNPLRILDSKNPTLKSIINQAPKITDFLSDASRQHFAGLREILDTCGLDYQVNPKLVRGLDYYTHNVFEWITEDLGAQGTICAGGRYDTLVEKQGGKPTAATGFAMGVDRLVELIKDKNLWTKPAAIDVFVISDKLVEFKFVQHICEKLRGQVPSLNMIVNMSRGSFKSQFKKADKSTAKFAIILGMDEIENEVISVKSMTDRSFGQKQMSLNELIIFFKDQPTKGN
ncbi:MAG: histidine--tRNA ligase [Proteobacteria bacterium]|nr:histidine--tRNA ligase [Pseudomonadota bacterium]